MQLLKKILQAINFGYYFEDSQEEYQHDRQASRIEVANTNLQHFDEMCSTRLS